MIHKKAALILVTAIITFSISHLAFTKDQQTCLSQYEINEPYEDGSKSIMFTYPCDWVLQNSWNLPSNADGSNDSATISTKDGHASFHYPAKEIKIKDITPQVETITLQNQEFPISKYHYKDQYDEEMIVIIDMGTELNETGKDIMFSYTNNKYEEDLYKIARSLKF